MEKNCTTNFDASVKEIIEKLENAWDVKFCNQEFTTFCNADCRGHYGCGPFCPIYRTYETAKQQIKGGIRSKPNVLTDLTTGVKYIVIEGQRVLRCPTDSQIDN